MEELSFDGKQALVINPNPGSSPADFDFLVGKWKVHNRKLKTRFNGCTEWEEFGATGEMRKILNGLGNLDNFCTEINNQPFEGMTLRLFNPTSRLWSIYWADSINGILDTPVVGSFENNIGHFYCRTTLQGLGILMRFEWNKADPANPVWRQAFSNDEGKNWEWNWSMNMSRPEK